MLPTKGCPENQYPALLTSGNPRRQSQAPFFLASPKPLCPFQEGPACWIVCETPLSFMAHLGSVEPDGWWVRVKAEQQEPQGRAWGWAWSSHQVWFHRSSRCWDTGPSVCSLPLLCSHCQRELKRDDAPPQLESLYLSTEHGSIFPKCPCHGLKWTALSLSAAMVSCPIQALMSACPVGSWYYIPSYLR